MSQVDTPLVNQDNIKNRITRAYVEERMSKSGKPYNVLITYWNRPNGKTYINTKFLSNEEIALIESSVSIESVL